VLLALAVAFAGEPEEELPISRSIACAQVLSPELGGRRTGLFSALD